jgi:hypothetical protein
VSDLGAAAEWAGLLRTAVLGTDRHEPPRPLGGWDRWASAVDPAVQVLDRAAAVTVARRTGARPIPAVTEQVPAAPVDRRAPCPAACRARLAQLLGGQHEVLLAEWFALAESHGVQLPWELLPKMLLRGRSRPELDQVVRRLAAGRDAWLATVVPSLGVRPRPASAAPPKPLRPPAPPVDSRAAVAGILAGLADGSATWAAAPQLVQLVAAVDVDALEHLLTGLATVSCPPICERVRIELTDLAATRRGMLHEFASSAPPPAAISDTISDTIPDTIPIDDRGDHDEPS